MVTPEIPPQGNLLSILRARQAREGLSDAAFAKKMGITKSLWTLTRLGQRRIYFELIRATIRTYPELCTNVIDFLRGEDHGKNNATTKTGPIKR